MSFGTVFKTDEDIIELLRSAYDAFTDVLNKMHGKFEFGLKVLWDRDQIIREIEEEDEDIRRLKGEISSQKGSTYFARMQYGRLIDAAQQVARVAHSDETDIDEVISRSEQAIFADIRASLDRMRVRFDEYFNEGSLYRDGSIERVVSRLRSTGKAYDREGAVWMGTHGGGLSRYQDGRFTNFTTEHGLASLYVWAIEQDRETELEADESLRDEADARAHPQQFGHG